ncbi:MAG TPA: hypothetical protein VJO53_02470 [Candidatus Acidoferrales bacterium]|nr:hypothetical protein [Candidatus Acidoferrales bacterium]
MNSSTLHRALLALLLLLSAAAPLARAKPTGDVATITYRKIFKSSYPEFVEIKVNQSGAGTCDIRQLSDDSNPKPVRIDAPIVQSIFGLAEKLHNFAGVDLEMHRRIANLGQKTFRYERGAEVHDVTFNYTLDRSASELLAIFESLARQQTDLSDLVRTMRYDRLGVNDVLLQIEKDYDHKLLPEPEQLLPPLDQVAADEHFIDIARQRARSLAGRIRASH